MSVLYHVCVVWFSFWTIYCLLCVFGNENNLNCFIWLNIYFQYILLLFKQHSILSIRSNHTLVVLQDLSKTLVGTALLAIYTLPTVKLYFCSTLAMMAKVQVSVSMWIKIESARRSGGVAKDLVVTSSQMYLFTDPWQWLTTITNRFRVNTYTDLYCIN